MKPMNYMKLLGDLPADLVDCAFLSVTVPQEQAGQAVRTGKIKMKKHAVSEKEHNTRRIGRAGIAAAVAVCIGLNAALIYGISRIKKDFVGFTPEIDETHPKYMELVDAMPTGIIFRITNDSEDALTYNPQFVVIQDGNKAADTELPPDYGYVQNPIPPGVCGQQLSFAQLPAGSYTLVNLAEDGETEGTLGHLDFEISSEYDSMVWVPDVRRMNCDEAMALLNEKDNEIEVYKTYAVYTRGDLDTDDVVMMEVPAYKTETDQYGIETGCYHFDGNGYWINKDDTVRLIVCTGADGETDTVPYVIGKAYEQAKNDLLYRGYHVDKRSAYYDDVPAGWVAEETVGNESVPEEGLEAPAGTLVRLRVSLGKRADAASADTVIVPEFKGMQWENAKKTAEELGLLPGKQYFDAPGEPAGTVTFQSYLPGDEVREGIVIMMSVAKDPDDNPPYMAFRIPENMQGIYYICLRDAQGTALGTCYPFRPNGFGTTEILYPDCTEENTKAEAILVNCETCQEAVIGSYILHPDTGTYDTITEDIEAAFSRIQ